MKKTVLTTLLAASLFAIPARAQDYCITFPGFNDVLVGRNFLPLPRRGQCKPWIGFSPTLGGGFNAPSHGGGCLSSDGTDFSLTITTGHSGIVVFDLIELNPVTGQGTDGQEGQEIGAPFSRATAVVGAACKSRPIPN